MLEFDARRSLGAGRGSAAAAPGSVSSASAKASGKNTENTGGGGGGEFEENQKNGERKYPHQNGGRPQKPTEMLQHDHIHSDAVV